MGTRLAATALASLLCAACADGASSALEPFVPDGNTLLLYHFEEDGDSTVRDESGRGHEY